LSSWRDSGAGVRVGAGAGLVSGVSASLASVWGVVLLLGLTACSEGCSKRELPVTEPEFADQHMSLAELEALLWPKSDQPERWRALPEPQLVALERVVTLLLERAGRGGLSTAERTRVSRWAELAGLELRQIVVEHAGGVETFWVLVEPPDDRRGRGSYLIRLGELEPAGAGAAKVELLLEAPHSRFDKYTGAIALELFVDGGAGRRPRALFVNSLHRYSHEDGRRGKREDAEGGNPADACHQEHHPLARSTARALGELELMVIQLHGFARDAAAGDPDLIVSPGSAQPSRASAAIVERLRAGFPELSVSHYGLDTDRLGATTNVQGWAARASGRCFVHVETSEAVRERLRDEPEARRRLAAALFEGSPQEFGRGCE
jgi:hypothetical protein